MTALPWSWPTTFDTLELASREVVTVDAARDGWVEVSVGAANGYLPPDKARELIAAVEAALAYPHPVGERPAQVG